MPFVPVPLTAQVELRYTYQGQQVENVLYVTRDTEWKEAGLTLLGAGILSWWETEVRPLLPAQALLREIYLSDQGSENGAVHTLTNTLPQSGTLVGTPLPNNNSICVQFRTAKRGRSFRGRNYWIGLIEEQVTGNNVLEPFALDIVSAYQALPSAVAAAVSGAFHSVASRFADGSPRVVGIATPVTSYAIVDTVVDSQRRRLPGRGN